MLLESMIEHLHNFRRDVVLGFLLQRYTLFSTFPKKTMKSCEKVFSYFIGMAGKKAF
jgi:hypothetical protein